MATPKGRYALHHFGAEYSFCSHQCRENFLAHPRLYVGDHAPAREGRHIIKHRRFKLELPLGKNEAKIVEQALAAMMGLLEVRIRGAEVDVVYDLLVATAAQVEERFTQAGARLGQGWGERFRSGWLHYIEENELENLEAVPRALNRPPPQ